MWEKRRNKGKIALLEAGLGFPGMFKHFPESFVRYYVAKFSQFMIANGADQIQQLKDWNVKGTILEISNNTIYDSLDLVDLTQESDKKKISISIHRTENINNKENMENALRSSYSNATELADWLVKNLNYSFRKSHGLWARIVNFSDKKGVKLDELNLSDYQKFDKNINKTVYNAISLQSSVDNKKSFGGTSRSGVKKMIKLAKKEILKWQES